jgi:hypothetical protein
MTKKIVVWLDSNFVTFSFLYNFQKKVDCEFYAIIDIVDQNKKFFVEQKFVKFKKIWFYYDHVNLSKINVEQKYLSNFEQKYDINLWELAINERTFYQYNSFHKFTTNEILSILEQECKLFENIIEQTKPDFCITKEIIQHKDELFTQMCKSNNIPVLSSYPTKLLNRYMISQDANKFDFDIQLSEIKSDDRTIEELRKYLKNRSNFSELQKMSETFLNSKIQKLRALIKFVKQRNVNNKTHYTYFGRTKIKVLVNEIRSEIKKKIRKNFIDKRFIQKIDCSEKFVYFPLQMDEESSLLLGAPHYTNQIESIREIVKSLPVDYKLYVKEHFSQSIRNWRDIREYKKIMSIPNVKLFHPNASSEDFFKKCSLVISAAGSSAFEATFYEKPSITFSNLHYSILPSVFYVKSLKELSRTIKNALTVKVNSKDLDKFLKCVHENTFDFDIYAYSQKELDTFFFGGQLIDVEITMLKMKSFLKENSKMFDNMINANIKKIEWFENKK